jgi:serine protease
MCFKAKILGLGLLSLAQSGFSLACDNSVRLIVKYKQEQKNSTSLKSQITQLTQLPIVEMNPMANGAYSLILDASKTITSKKKDATDLVLDHLRTNPDILYAVRDRVGHFSPVPDPVNLSSMELLSHESQWDEFGRPAGIMLESKPGLRDGAWAYTTGSSSKPIVVAVLDTGIALHESLMKNLVKDDLGNVWGWNFSANNNKLGDETRSFHGTHVAGTIAGYGQVMHGMGEDLNILPLKIAGASGMFYESSVINAIYWSVGGEVPGVPSNRHPAKVLNMSFGVDRGPKDEVDYCDQALQEAVSFARNKSAVLVVAAGNDNHWEHYNAPGVCNGTIKVASTGPEGLRSYFSNYGPGVTLAAPGGDKRYGLQGGILSTVNPGGGYQSSGFDFYQGTSMASPHVAGVAGLIFAATDKTLTAEQVEQILYATTHNFGVSHDANNSCVGKKPCGHGILDAENAVKAAQADYDLIFSAPKREQLAKQACGKKELSLSQTKITVNNAVWLQHHTACEKAKNYSMPHVEQTKNENIIAHYGSVSYRLDQTIYKECHIIGYDGVGCYL